MREFLVMQRGYLKKQRDRQIHEWDLVRTITAFLLQPHMKKGKTLKPKDIIPLPLDKKKSKLESLEKRREKAQYALKKREHDKTKKRKKSLSRKTSLLDKL